MTATPERNICALLVALLLLSTGCRRAATQSSADNGGAARWSGIEALRRNFEQPPDDAKIVMRWWWFGPCVTPDELEREMRMMKEGGIGGFEVQTVYPLALDDPSRGFRNFSFLSDEHLNALRFAAAKARELGLRMDVTLGSGWPYGGPHIPVTQAAGRLRVEQAAVPPGAGRVALPDIAAGEHLIAAFAGPSAGDSPALDARALQRVSDIRDGALYLPRADAPRVVVFFIASRTGMMVKRAAVGAEGFVLDHYDRAAIDSHLRAVGDRLMRAFPSNLRPRAVFSDSLEVYASDWTGDFLEEFRRRRGYDLTPYLPALAADIGDNTGAIRNDWVRTLTELAEERYLAPLRDWAHRNGTLLRSQTYGVPPVTLSSNALADLPEGEGSDWRRFTPARWAASASHLYGRPVASSETWTWLHSPAFRATPLDMKAEADRHFLQGITQLVGHGWPYSPPGEREPGWRFYAAAVFNEHNPWWIAMPSIASYLQRVSFLLRQGAAANDVAVYLPTADARARTTVGHASISEAMNGLLGPDIIPQILDAGYNLDFIDDQAIERVSVPYRILVLPGVERIPLSAYRKIAEFVARGGIVAATRRVPSRAPGLAESGTDGPAIVRLSELIFNEGRANAVLVPTDAQLGDALTRRLAPDFVTSPRAPEIGFIHRRLPNTDIYFLANTSNRPLRAQAVFSVAHARAEQWDPYTGSASGAPITGSGGTFTAVDVRLEPYESRVLVFSRAGGAAPAATAPASEQAERMELVDLSRSWSVTFPKLQYTTVMDQLRSWSEDEKTRFYSGTAIYHKSFECTAEVLKAAGGVYLDFGDGTPQEQPPARAENGMRALLEAPVREAAAVYVNGRNAGVVWHPPYRLKVTEFLHPGSNSLKVEVGNLAINTLAGQSLPNYRLLKSRYGDRFTPQDMDGLEPLPSGLLGRVALVSFTETAGAP